MQITFDADLDGALRVLPHPHLACENNCEKTLGKLATRLGTTTLPGVRPAPEGHNLYEIVTVNREGEVVGKTLVNRHGLTVRLEAPQSANTLDPWVQPAKSSNEFSALWLIPGGVGQFSQDRVGWGVTWAVVEAGLLAWNIQANVSFDNAESALEQDKAKSQATISAIALYSTLALGVVEAVVTGLLMEPDGE